MSVRFLEEARDEFLEQISYYEEQQKGLGGQFRESVVAATALAHSQTGAGFGCRDYRTVWLKAGKITGLRPYKSSRPASSCVADIRPIKWEEAPAATIEIRNR